MKWDLSEKALRSGFLAELEERSGQNVSDCCQCGKCSGGCPIVGEVELTPNRVLRMAQLGLEEEALSNETIWRCVACGTGNGRCPMGVDIVRIIDTLRAMTLRRNVPPKGRCAACYSRLKHVNQELKEDPKLLAQVNEIIEEDYTGNVRVVHIAEVLTKEIGPAGIEPSVSKPLDGLKVACYYGCLMARLPDALRVDRPEYPELLDNLLRAAGAETVDWPCKTECCGASLTLAGQETAIRLSGQIVEMAKDGGADAIAVACPLCQANLDMFQSDAEEALDRQFGLPALYFTQLLGLALGIAPDRLGLDKLIVDPLPMLAEKGFVAGGVYL